MEEVLDVHKRPYNAKEPVVNMDETTKQLTEEIFEPLPIRPGQPQRYDTVYRRAGVATVFMFFEPLAGWRHVEITERKTRCDWAHQIKELLQVHYPRAEKIHLVLDNLNTHNGASLYETFPPEQARQMVRRLEFHYTPKHGSWLNMAEIELSILSRQCLNRRIPDTPTLIREIQHWETDRNNKPSTVDWHFTTEDARIKLKKLYPTF